MRPFTRPHLHGAKVDKEREVREGKGDIEHSMEERHY